MFNRFEESTYGSRSVKELPESLTSLCECAAPPSKPVVPLHPVFGLLKEQDIHLIVSSDDFAWLISRFFTRYQVEVEPVQTCVPVRSAYHSSVNEALSLTRVGAPPLSAILPTSGIHY